MQKPVLKWGIFLLASIIFILLFFFQARLKNAENLSEAIIEIKNHRLLAEVVSQEAKRQMGLSGRVSLCADCAMLFVFDAPGKYSFWMKDMQFDLDILWLRENRVVYIAKKVSHEKGKMEEIAPGVLADRVLEVNAGLADKWDIRVGDQIMLK